MSKECPSCGNLAEKKKMQRSSIFNSFICKSCWARHHLNNNKITEAFWEELKHQPKYENIYILVSGGRDSTYTAYQFFTRELPAILLHHNTTLRLPSAIKTLDWLKIVTRYPYIETKPECDVKQILKESFLVIDKLKEMDYYHKKHFKCCYFLKEKPFRKFLRLNPDIRQTSIIISSIRPGEGNKRSYFLNKLRQKGTFFNFNKKFRVMYGYPLRDTKAKDITKYFKKRHWNEKIKHSGCSICPVVYHFNLFKKSPKQYIASKKFYLKLKGVINC
jgi:3'-phosphoadenosine 5'-phosphosulfate sulfotransferase (PAPS reductase)/FAD synthetase